MIATGAVLMAYPFVSNYLYENRQKEVIYGYQQETEEMDNTEIENALQEARNYNTWLNSREVVLTDPFDPEALADLKDSQEYERLLDLSGSGIMGYVEIPEINVYLPVYHGTSQEVLEKGVGHLENTSLPVGGENTHCILSAHTGLSDKKLFTDLVLLEEGSCFYLHVLNQTLAYKVDQILTVKPEETSALRIVQGQDLVTLITCTPYGVNSHRLLVRGHRIPYEPEAREQTSVTGKTSPWMRQYLLSILTGIVLLITLITGLYLYRRKRS
nr:class C sortase [Blautia sp. MSJ-19]